MTRDPDAILQELGERLRAGYARADRAPWWRRLALRRSLVLGLVLAAFASSALATRNVLRGPAIPDLPAQLRAPLPDRSGPPMYVADGRGWRLSAAACDFGREHVIAPFLDLASGGGGTRCVPGARRVQTYYDPPADRTWVFGVVRSDATRAEVRAGGARAVVATLALDARAATAAGVDPRLRAFVTSLPGVVTTYDLILSCNSRSCR